MLTTGAWDEASNLGITSDHFTAWATAAKWLESDISLNPAANSFSNSLDRNCDSVRNCHLKENQALIYGHDFSYCIYAQAYCYFN